MLARITIVLFFTINLSHSGECQQKFEISSAREFFLPTLKKNFYRDEKIPFKEIIIQDYRFDSSKLGYVRDYGVSKIVAYGSISEFLTKNLNQYFRNNLTKSSEDKLIIILKTMWLQQNVLNLTNIEDQKNKLKFESEEGNKTGACIADIEIFSNKGEMFQPLLKIKSNFYYGPYTTGKLWEFLLMPFDSLFIQIIKTDVQKELLNRKSYSLTELDSGYINRFRIPVLSQSVLKRGVFLTFDDFISNDPKYSEFEVKYSKLTDQLYLKTENGDELLTDFWGYCDGKDYFFYSGLNFFKMVRQNNTWDIFGNTYVTNKSHMIDLSNKYGDFMMPSFKKKTELRPLQLNMETGKVY